MQREVREWGLHCALARRAAQQGREEPFFERRASFGRRTRQCTNQSRMKLMCAFLLASLAWPHVVNAIRLAPEPLAQPLSARK